MKFEHFEHRGVHLGAISRHRLRARFLTGFDRSNSVQQAGHSDRGRPIWQVVDLHRTSRDPAQEIGKGELPTLRCDKVFILAFAHCVAARSLV